MIDLLLACTLLHPLYELDKGNWIGINSIIVMMSIVLASLVLALSKFLSTQYVEKVRMIVKYEITEGFVSLMIIFALLTLTSASYTAVCSLTTSAAGPGFNDPFQFATSYLSNLLFIKGIGMANKMYYASTVLAVDGKVLDYTMSTLASFATASAFKTKFVGPLGSLSVGIVFPSDQVEYLYYDYVSVLGGFLSSTIILTFGMLFIMFLILPAIQYLSLTVVVPVAIALRSLAFTGPNLRVASNTIIALSIALYFIFPLTLAMDSYVTNWVWCINMNAASCNPYVAYLTPYALNNNPMQGLLSSNTAPTSYDNGAGVPISMPIDIYSQLIAGNGGLVSTLETLLKGLVNTPGIIGDYTMQTSQYLFQGIVLMALDIAITVGFAQGFAKGLNSVSQLVGTGQFW